MKTNEIRTARNAIRAALKVEAIELEESGMYRVGMESLSSSPMCLEAKCEMVRFAVNDVYHAEREKQRIAVIAWMNEDSRRRKENSDAVQQMYAEVVALGLTD